MESYRIEETIVYTNFPDHGTKLAVLPVYYKILHLFMVLKLIEGYWGFMFYKVNINHDRRFTLSYFSQRLIWSPVCSYFESLN